MFIIISHLWYDTAHDFEMGQARVFRCAASLRWRSVWMWRGCLSRPLHTPLRETLSPCRCSLLCCRNYSKRTRFFYKEHYPSMRLVEENGRYYIHGFYNVGEEEFIADYFIHYGDEVQTVESMALREVIRTRLRTLTMHYKEYSSTTF